MKYVIKYLVFNFFFDIYCFDFFVVNVLYKVYFKKVKKNLQNFKILLFIFKFIIVEDCFIIIENRIQFICIYIFEGFYLDSFDIIVVFGQIKVEDYLFFDDLVYVLIEGLKNDVQKVCVIFIWIGLQGLNGSGLKDKNNNN